MKNSFTIGRVRGIEIQVHYTLLFAFLLVAWSLAAGYYPSNFSGWEPTTYWVLGFLSALLLFGSVLVHELSHSFVALSRGIGVDSITLFIFGGVSNLKAESEEPKDEFLISVVGPLTSLVLAGVFWGLAGLIAPAASPIGAMLGYLALINLMLGLFNLVPGFPLDGGRVLRSIVWGVTGSLRQATNVASYVGQGFGFLLIFWGLSQLLGGNFLNGLWIAFIGWFLNSAAEATREQQVVQENLRGVRVAELMNPSPPIAYPGMTVQEFVCDHVVRQGQRAMLVADDGQLQGIVSITDAKEIPQDAWPRTTVGQIMTPSPLKSVTPDTDLSQALQLLVDDNLNQVPVLQDGRLAGMLNRADVLRYLQVRDELHLRRAQGGRPRPVPA